MQVWYNAKEGELRYIKKDIFGRVREYCLGSPIEVNVQPGEDIEPLSRKTKISLLCPTRGRPREFSRCIDSFLLNSCHEIETVVLFDNEDKTRHRYPNMSITTAVSGPAEEHGTVQMWNTLAAWATGNYLMMINDDNIMETKGWDIKLLAQIPADDMFVAWPNGQQAQCINPIVSRRWYETVGWFVPPGFKWFYADTALHSLGAWVGRLVYMPNVVCRPTIHKPLEDNVENRRDQHRFEDFKRNNRPKLAKKIWEVLA